MLFQFLGDEKTGEIKKIYIQEWSSFLLNTVNSNDNNIFKNYKEKNVKYTNVIF